MADAAGHFLDYNAGGAVDPRVLERFVAVEREAPGNAGSLHAAGRRARGILEGARREVADALGVDVDRVVFTSGGTESDNLAVRGLGDPALPVACAALEHPAVAEPADRRGVLPIPVDGAGFVVVGGLPDAWGGARPGLVAVVHGQNETGCVQPVADVARLARELIVPLHVDAAQTLGRLPLGPVLEVADSVALSMHKAGGPKGIGISIVRDPSAIRPLSAGGGQEQGLRPGTVPVALAAAAAETVRLAVAEQEIRAVAMRAARDRFVERLEAGLDRGNGDAVVRLLTPRDERGLPNTAACHFPQVRDGRNLLPALDIEGVYASLGAACSSGSPRPPRAFLAFGFDEDSARRCVRFSFGPCTSIDDAEDAALRVARVVERLTMRPRA